MQRRQVDGFFPEPRQLNANTFPATGNLYLKAIKQSHRLHLSMTGSDALFAVLNNLLKANKKLFTASRDYQPGVNAHQHE